MRATKRPQTPSQERAAYGQHENIQAVMDAAFGNTAGAALGAKFDVFVDNFLPKCSKFDIASFIRIAGKKSRNNTSSHMIRRLPDIARKLDSMASSTWKYKDIAFIMYGLQSCKESDDGYLTIMSTMSKIVTRTAERDEAILSQSLAMILYGLRSNKFKQKESREMLSCLHRIAIKCQEPFGAQAVGNALYGLQGMSSDNAEVRSVVRALSGQVERCREPLGAQAVANALYGLQGMSSDNAEVRSLLRALSGQVERCREPLSAQAVGNALYGLAGVLGVDEGRDLGLHLMRTFLGLHRNGVLVSSDFVYLGQSVVMVLPLLKDHLTEEEVKECELIISDIEIKSHAPDEDGDSLLKDSFQSRSEQHMHSATVKAFAGSKLRVSHNEHLFGLFECDIVVRVPRVVDTSIEEGGRGDGRDPVGEREEQSLVINIEVDGVHHRREKKKRFCKMRDEYLVSRGVVIERMEVSTLRAMSEQEVEEWVLDITAKAMVSRCT